MLSECSGALLLRLIDFDRLVKLRSELFSSGLAQRLLDKLAGLAASRS